MWWLRKIGSPCWKAKRPREGMALEGSDRRTDPLLDNLDLVIERLDAMSSRLNVLMTAVITNTVAIVGLIATVLLTG